MPHLQDAQHVPLLLQAQLVVQLLGCDSIEKCSRSSLVKVAMEVVAVEVEVVVAPHTKDLDK